MRYYFDWMIDHRFTDFLKAKRDLLLFPPDAAALARFREAVRALASRADADAALVAADPQRAFFLRRFRQELEPLDRLELGGDLEPALARVQDRLTEVVDQVRAYTK
jgi:hypothetical protein